jgi:large subunit ribosomal protein L24e
MARCSFCRGNIERGTGTMYVMNDGKIFRFCSMKCQKNTLKLRRLPRFLKWTGAFEKTEPAKKESSKKEAIKKEPSKKEPSKKEPGKK